jgi:hypothetical protein
MPLKSFSYVRLMTVTLLLVVLVCHGAAWQHRKTQSDWSSGPGVAGPVTDWGTAFAEADGISWRVLPGQLTLASTPLGSPLGHPLDGLAPGALKVIADDVDSDGDTDVLVAAYYEDTVTLWHNLGGTPPEWRAEVITSGYVHPGSLATADVDRDGRIDILSTASEAGHVTWWRNLGGDPPVWARYQVADQVAGGHDIAGADLDGDGDTDLVVPAFEDDELLWFSNDGGDPIEWTRHLIAGSWDYPCKVAVADIDNDGDPDIIATAWLAEEVAWWRNDGGSPIQWHKQTITTGFTGTHWVDCADVDGDGALDVLAAAMDRAEVAWWRNLGGDPVDWQRHTITSSLAGAVSVHAADIDGDGDVDVAAGGWSASGGVVWFESRSNGQGWRRHPVDTSFGECSSVHLADVDGDGGPDLLASFWNHNQVRWWQLTELQGNGTLTSSILDTRDTTGTNQWLGWQWQGEVPTGTSLVLEARVSNDPQEMGEWHEIDSEDLSDQLVDETRYLQYRVEMLGGPTIGSPLLRSISFNWSSDNLPSPRRPRGRTHIVAQ